MRVAYIAHPIGGDIKENLKRIEAIARQINLEEPEVVPFANYFLDCHALDDNIPEERERGIKNDIALMRKGFIDELRLYGDRISAGMSHEVDMAIELGIEVKPMTEATMREYIAGWFHKYPRELWGGPYAIRPCSTCKHNQRKPYIPVECEQCAIQPVSNLLIAWEQYKKANWWDSEAIDVEKVLMEKFIAINCG